MPELAAVGTRLERTVTVDAAQVAAFADLVADANPIYVDEAFAARTAYGRPLVHGALVVGHVLSVLSELTGPGYVMVGQEARFTAAVHAGDEITVTAEVIRVREDRGIVSVESVVTRADGVVAFRGVGGLMLLDTGAGGEA